MSYGYPHKVTKWVATPNGYGGFTFGAPAVLDGKWENISEAFKTEEGETIVSKAVVFLLSDVSAGDYLYLGQSAAVDPTTLTGSARVRVFQRITDLRGARVERKAVL